MLQNDVFDNGVVEMPSASIFHCCEFCHGIVTENCEP